MELYSYVLPPGTNIFISVEPFSVDDSVPTEDEIEWAVKNLCDHRSGGPSGMQTEHLKKWLEAARKAEKDATTAGVETTEDKEIMAFKTSMEPTEAANWEMVVELIQTEFQEVKLVEESTRKAVVLITKGKKDYRGIGLVEVMCKVVADILNRRLMAFITFQDFLQDS